MQRGGPVIFFPTNGGREAFFIYLLIPFIKTFGPTPFAMRALTATISLLTVVMLTGFLYQLPRTLLPVHPTRNMQHALPISTHLSGYRFWLTALASLALATSYWHIAISRLGQRPILVPMLSVPMFWFFLKGWATGQKRWFALSGIFMGLEGHTYSAARLLPLILALAILPEIFFAFKRKSSSLTGHSSRLALFTNLVIFALVAALIYLPMAWYLLNHPAQFTARAGSVMVWNFLDTPQQIVAEIGRNLLRVSAFFCCDGSPNVLFGLPHYPGSHPAVLPFLLAGLIGSLIRWRSLFPRLVAIWWLVGVLASTPAIEAPHPLRMIVAVAPTAILIALGPVYLAEWLSTKMPTLAPQRLLLLAVPIILAPALDNWPAYYRDWTQLQATRGAYDYGAVAIRNTIFEQAGSQTAIYLPFSRFNAPNLLYYLSDRFPRQAALAAPPAPRVLVISPDRYVDDHTWVRLHNGQATVLPPLDERGRQMIKTALTGNSAAPIATADGEIVARLAELPTDPAQFAEQPARLFEVDFGPVQLTGATYPMIITPPAEIPVTLYWQANRQTTTEYEVLVRLVDDSLRAWGNGDARPTDWVYPTTFWRPGLDRIGARHTVTLNGDPPPGRYWLAVSVFDPPNGQRLPLTANVSASPDTFFIGPLKVPLSPLPQTEAITAIQPIGFGNAIQLAGLTISPTTVTPGQSVQLNLLWQAQGTPEQDYTVFVHLLNQNGALAAGQDTQPVKGQYPTTIWTPGEQIPDVHLLPLPKDLPPGLYRLAIGLYHQPTGQRLPIRRPGSPIDPQGRLILPSIVTVIAQP